MLARIGRAATWLLLVLVVGGLAFVLTRGGASEPVDGGAPPVPVAPDADAETATEEENPDPDLPQDIYRATVDLLREPAEGPGLRRPGRTPELTRRVAAALVRWCESQGETGRGDRPAEVVELYRRIASGEIEIGEDGQPRWRPEDLRLLRRLARAGGFRVRYRIPGKVELTPEEVELLRKRAALPGPEGAEPRGDGRGVVRIR
jgi:hypothetical protein